MHGVVISALAPSPAERVEQLGIGEGAEEILDRLERGAVFQRVPIEQRLGRVQDHHGRGTIRRRSEEKDPYRLLRNKSPQGWRLGRKIAKKRALPDKVPRKQARFGGMPRRTPAWYPNCVAFADSATDSPRGDWVGPGWGQSIMIHIPRGYASFFPAARDSDRLLIPAALR